VTATSGTLTATGTVSVRPPDPPVAISISPSTLSLIPGGVEAIVARATDSTGRVADATFEWSSADPAVATVGRTDGVVTAVSVGATTVTVTSGLLSATAPVSVVDFSGAFAFTRTSSLGAGRYATDVLSYSASDRMLQPLLRASEFASIAAPAWSPDGTLLAIEVIRTFFGPPEFEWLDYTGDLYVLDATAPSGSPWRALTTNGLSRLPSWSPDGRWIAYLEQDALFSFSHISVIGVAGGASTRLTTSEGYYGRPHWSPDGTRLAFSAYLNGSNYSQIFIVNANGSELTRIAPGTTSYWDPSWSPDGARLAFIRFRNEAPGSYLFDVMITDVDGRNVRQVMSSADWSSAPVWSPDGRQIMFSSGGALYVMQADGSGLTRITSPPNNSWDSAPVWRR
jgi:dipeptidyl aminopeptidase/acylaminoacyl peptidase